MKKQIAGAKRSKRSRIAVSAVIGTVIMFAMLLSVAGTYFYVIQQDQAAFQKAVAQSNNDLLNEQSAEHLTVYGICSKRRTCLLHQQYRELQYQSYHTGCSMGQAVQ